VTYTITVSNAGPAAAAGATVTNNMPAALTAVNWTCAPAANCGSTNGSGNILATVSLASGESATFTVTATVAATATGSIVNTATVTPPASVNDTVPGNNTATDTDTVLIPADLAITVTDNQTLVNRGTQIRYAIVVSNVGTTAVNGATVADNFPGALQGLSGTVNWTCATTGGATCGGNATGSGSINRTVNMPVGSTITFTTTSGSVSTNTVLAQLSNTATVGVPAGYQDTNLSNNSATDTTTIQGFHLAVLSGAGANTSTTQWEATVTVTVHDANHNLQAGAIVSGNWLANPLFTGGSGGTGGTSCVTGASGQCTLIRSSISTGKSQTSLTVTGITVTGSNNVYQLGQNEAALSVTVPRP
jgi:uncharacterized repeat protein (TIGR01451 family)